MLKFIMLKKIYQSYINSIYLKNKYLLIDIKNESTFVLLIGYDSHINMY